jgi:transposase
MMFLPPYSPDFNPIELAFSAIKAYVQHARELARKDVDQASIYIHLLEAAYSVTSEDAEGYFHHCGYL